MTELQATLILILLITLRFILPAAATYTFGKVLDRFALNPR